MGDFERLTAAQLRETVQVLDEWIAGQRHEAEVEAEVLDQDGAQAIRERADRVAAVRSVLAKEAAKREASPSPGGA